MNILTSKNNHLLSYLHNIRNKDGELVKKSVRYQFPRKYLIIKKNASSLSRALTPDVLILPQMFEITLTATVAFASHAGDRGSISVCDRLES